MTRISFIMPTFNRSNLITESLESVLAQAEAGDEILVLDDGSTDATETVVAALGPRVHYARQENAGKSAALNRALAMTDGDYVWICDDDDLLRAGAVARLVGALETTGADFVFGRHERFQIDPAGRRVEMGTGYWPDLTTGTLARHILEDAFVMQHGTLVRRACYARVGRFNEAFLRSQDYEMFVRLALGGTGAFVDTVVFDQRKHDGLRGTAANQHGIARVDDIWQQYDQLIFTANPDLVSRGVFTAMFNGSDPDLVARAALLQRACVHARHGLWSVAVDDLNAAAAVCSDRSLHPVERAICGRLLGSKHGFAGALASEIVIALRQLRRQPGGASIVRAVLAGLLWRLRRDKPEARRAAWSLLAAVGSAAGIARIVYEHIAARGSGEDDALQEGRVMWAPPAGVQASRK